MNVNSSLSSLADQISLASTCSTESLLSGLCSSLENSTLVEINKQSNPRSITCDPSWIKIQNKNLSNLNSINQDSIVPDFTNIKKRKIAKRNSPTAHNFILNRNTTDIGNFIRHRKNGRSKFILQMHNKLSSDQSLNNLSDRQSQTMKTSTKQLSGNNCIPKHKLKRNTKKAPIISKIISKSASLDKLPSDHDKEDDIERKKEIEKLSPWERWLLEKEVIRIKETQVLKQKKIEILKQKTEEKNNKCKREQLYRIKFREWLQRKNEEMKQAQIAVDSERHKKMVELALKNTVKVRSEEKYARWLDEKRRLNSAQKMQQEAFRRERQQVLEKQQSAANEAFNRWKLEASKHKRKLTYSYGLSDGILTRYFDRTANPQPSFINKEKWNH